MSNQKSMQNLKNQIIMNFEKKNSKWESILKINIIIIVLLIVCLISILVYSIILILISNSVSDIRLFSLGFTVFGVILFRLLSKLYKLTTVLNHKNDEFINIKNRIILTTTQKELQEILVEYNVYWKTSYTKDNHETI